MYLEHFGLKEFPFRLTPDSDFLFMSSAHARAKAYMDYTVWNREGFVVITGEIGCGKTTLLQKLLSELNDENVLVAKIFQTQLNEVEFLQAVLVEFGINPFTASKVELMDMLNTFLNGVRNRRDRGGACRRVESRREDHVAGRARGARADRAAARARSSSTRRAR